MVTREYAPLALIDEDAVLQMPAARTPDLEANSFGNRPNMGQYTDDESDVPDDDEGNLDGDETKELILGRHGDEERGGVVFTRGTGLDDKQVRRFPWSVCK